LARDLSERSWTLCTGFQFGSYLFLNDSTSENGAQEFAVVLITDEDFIQIESITFGWCTVEQAQRYVLDALTGKMDKNTFAKPIHPRLDLPEDHVRCPLCA
jgi:hypothetical protein